MPPSLATTRGDGLGVLAELLVDAVDGVGVDPRRDRALPGGVGDTALVLAHRVPLDGVGTGTRPVAGVDGVLAAALGNDEIQLVGTGDLGLVGEDRQAPR